MNSSTRIPGGLFAFSVSPFALLSGVDRCVSCEAPLSGNYCAQCGERRPDRSHLRISNFLHRTLEEVADFEHSKLVKTLRLLFFRPGYLTTEFLRGAVKPYLGPVKLYITAFALSLFLYSIYRTAAIYDVRSLVARDPGVYEQSWAKSAGKALAVCLTYIVLKSVGTGTSLLVALSVTGRASW